MAELDRIRAKIGPCPAGSAVVTGAGRLRAKYIIHAVGPVYRGGGFGEAKLLASCYRESFRLASEQGAASIAFPAISAGIYGYPIDEAAEIAVREVRAGLELPGPVQTAIFVLFNDDIFVTFQRANSTA